MGLIQASSKVSSATAITNWIYLALAVFGVMVFLLSEVDNCGSQQFCATTIFFLTFLGSFFMLTILWVISSQAKQRLADGNVIFFFLQGVTIPKLIWVPIGYLGVLGISFGSTFLDFEYAVHLGIFGSGMIMLIAFLATKSILIPILIHGFYNVTVIILRAEGGLAQLPINVPEIGQSISIFGQLFSEVFFQMILVAPAEEFFKVFAMAFIIVSTRGKFGQKGVIVWIAGIFAVGVWTLYHTISAI